MGSEQPPKRRKESSIDVRCPSCRYSPVEHARERPDTDAPRTRDEVLDCYEVGGADDGCVFCPECACEFNTPTGEMPDAEPYPGMLF